MNETNERLSDGKNLKPLFQFCVYFHNSTFMAAAAAAAQHIQSLLILFHPTQNLSLVCPFSFHSFSLSRSVCTSLSLSSLFPNLPKPDPGFERTNERISWHTLYREFSIAFCADDGTVYRSITSYYINIMYMYEVQNGMNERASKQERERDDDDVEGLYIVYNFLYSIQHTKFVSYRSK